MREDVCWTQELPERRRPERKNYDRPASVELALAAPRGGSAVQILQGQNRQIDLLHVLHRPGVVLAEGCRRESLFPGKSF